MTLAQLRYIVALDTNRHFRQAAAQIGISQPSLSNQLTKLERELGVQLFERSKKPILPTKIGEEVIAQARVILAETERLHLLLKGITGEMAGVLRVGILPSMAPYMVPTALRAFMDTYPDVVLNVQELLSEQIIEYIKRDFIDIGLITTPISARGMVEEVLFEESLVCYVSEGHPLFEQQEIAPKSLSIEDIWLLNEGHPLRDQVIKLCPVRRRRKQPKKTLQYQSDSIEALKRLVEGGRGMTVIPEMATKNKKRVNPALIRPFASPAMTRSIRMIHAKRFLSAHLAQALASEIQACFQKPGHVEL